MAQGFKHNLKQFWNFIWNDDSWLSWIVNIALAFVLIKYALFPVLGLVLGSKFPVVAVVSGSMVHDGNFDTWWNSPAVCNYRPCTQGDYYLMRNITKAQFESFRFKNGFNKGDVMVLTSAKNLKIGDTVVYFASDGRPIIHRLISLKPLETKGDHNVAQIITTDLNEVGIDPGRLIGKATFRVPLIGYIKIWFVAILNTVGVHLK